MRRNIHWVGSARSFTQKICSRDGLKRPTREARTSGLVCAEGITRELLRQFEDYRDLRLNIYWLAIEKVGLVFPLFHGILSGVSEERRAT